jgi:RimJ/RimL family protein N-acetyltransferase
MHQTLFPERIETDRLRYDRFDRAIDAPTLYEYTGRSVTIAEERQHMTWDPHDTLKDAADVIESFRDSWLDGETATYAIVPKPGESGAGDFAGTMVLFVDWEKQRGTLGIWLRKPFWGRGYSAERAGALTALAFDRLDLDLIKSTVHARNEKSISAVEKYVERLGGRHEGLVRNDRVEADGTPAHSHHYSISQTEWREAVGEEHGVTFLDELPDDHGGA